MGTHRIYIDVPDGLTPGSAIESLVITGDEAQHAVRVRRLVVGDAIELCNGRGLMAQANIASIQRLSKSGGWAVTVALRELRYEAFASPRVELLTAAPKGDHLETMIEMLSQIGVTAWRPLRCDRSVVEPRPGKLERLKRVAGESMKQCGRAWLMEIGDEIGTVDACEPPLTMIADSEGQKPHEVIASREFGDSRMRVLVGPEGGWTDEERSLFRRAGCAMVDFGPHVMRIETAAVAAAAIVMDRCRSLR